MNPDQLCQIGHLHAQRLRQALRRDIRRARLLKAIDKA